MDKETHRKEKGGTWIFHGLIQSLKGGKKVSWFFSAAFLIYQFFHQYLTPEF